MWVWLQVFQLQECEESTRNLIRASQTKRERECSRSVMSVSQEEAVSVGFCSA